jgi:hypothetical protein
MVEHEKFCIVIARWDWLSTEAAGLGAWADINTAQHIAIDRYTALA